MSGYDWAIVDWSVPVRLDWIDQYLRLMERASLSNSATSDAYIYEAYYLVPIGSVVCTVNCALCDSDDFHRGFTLGTVNGLLWLGREPAATEKTAVSVPCFVL